MKNTIKLLKAVSDKNRFRILKLLQHKEGCCVCEIQAVLSLSQSTTSRHLQILESAELIYTKRDGKWLNCYLNRQNKQNHELLKLISKWHEDDPQTQNDYLKLKKINRNELCTN